MRFGFTVQSFVSAGGTADVRPIFVYCLRNDIVLPLMHNVLVYSLETFAKLYDAMVTHGGMWN